MTDKGRRRGIIRFYSPSADDSFAIPVEEDCTAEDLCQLFNVPIICLQIASRHIVQLSPQRHVLRIQNEILANLGYESDDELALVGNSSNWRHIFAFFIGWPSLKYRSSAASTTCGVCLFRKGGLLRYWTRKYAVLDEDDCQLNLYPLADDEEEVGDGSNCVDSATTAFLTIPLSRYRIKVLTQCGHLGAALKFSPHSSQRAKENQRRADGGEKASGAHTGGRKMTQKNRSACYYLAFEDASVLNKWAQRIQESQIGAVCDFSGRALLSLPSALVDCADRISELNLSNNSLQYRPAHTTSDYDRKELSDMAAAGWLEDLSAFRALQLLNLANNLLTSVPYSILALAALTHLNLSENRIAALPRDFSQLKNLRSLNLSNNRLTTVPSELCELKLLELVDLSFNWLARVPHALYAMKALRAWLLAGNYLTQLDVQAQKTQLTIFEMDLRLNPLRIIKYKPSAGRLDALSHLNLSRCANIAQLDLRHLPALKILRCEAIRLQKLALNGSAIREIYASQNELSELIVMPTPVNLRVFDVSRNNFVALPDWLIYAKRLQSLRASRNYLRKLPDRIFWNVSALLSIDVSHNDLRALPPHIENCFVEVLNVEANRLERLPDELFISAHKLRHLNASFNELSDLPRANSLDALNNGMRVLKLARNVLDEKCFETISRFKRLRLLDLCNNRIESLNKLNLRALDELNKLNLSGNLLENLPRDLFELPELKILRAHSNFIKQIPHFDYRTSSNRLRAVDLSNNLLESIPTQFFRFTNLCQLDLTCNAKVRAETLNDAQHRPFMENGPKISLCDVGRNAKNFELGFSETSTADDENATNERIVRQLRNLNYDIFAMIDGTNSKFVRFAEAKLYEILQRQSIVNNLERGNSTNLRGAILRLNESIGEHGRMAGGSVLVLQINSNGYVSCAASGTIGALLISRDTNEAIGEEGETKFLAQGVPLTASSEYQRIRRANATISENEMLDGVCETGRGIGYAHLHPAFLPLSTATSHIRPATMSKSAVAADAEFIIIANQAVWRTITVQQIKIIVKNSKNCQQIAKNIQAAAEAFECESAVSVIVIHLWANPHRTATNALMTASAQRKQEPSAQTRLNKMCAADSARNWRMCEPIVIRVGEDWITRSDADVDLKADENDKNDANEEENDEFRDGTSTDDSEFDDIERRLDAISHAISAIRHSSE